MKDFTAITETPGSPLNQEQLARITQRYCLGATLAQGKDVLEVACGAGIGLGVLQQSARSLVGCDYTGQVLAVAQRHYGRRVPLVCADAQHLPLAEQSFDLVLSFEAIYYLNRIDWFLAEAHRLLRPEGMLLIGTSNPDWPHFVAGQLSVHYPTLPELTTQLYRAGFHHIQGYGGLPIQAGALGRQRLLAALRRQILRHKIFTGNSPLTRILKQLAYGRLVALPADLSSLPHAVVAEDNSLPSIPPAAPDQVHRVLFAVAKKVVSHKDA